MTAPRGRAVAGAREEAYVGGSADGPLRSAPVAMDPVVEVLLLSEAFSQVWDQLARSAGAVAHPREREEGLDGLSHAAAVIVAAGGVEEMALPAIRELHAIERLPIAVVGATADHRRVVALLKEGADEVFLLPEDLSTLRAWIAERVQAVSSLERSDRLAAEQRSRFDFSNMVGRSPALQAALERAARVIPRGGATILVTGETGTGKELLARAIHYNGPRAARPFVEVNCAALPAHLLEAELFGYEAGAFTDAKAAKPGLFEAADGGTLFLDEIGDLSLDLQGKLLRALETKRVRRLGSLREHDVDVRIVAATHVDLAEASRLGRFRADLYYRLSVVPVRLPPLRERGEDVLLLADHFLRHLSREYEVPVPTLGAELKRALRAYPWPGNVRELKNSLERAVVLGTDGIRSEDLFLEASDASPAPSGGAYPFPATLEEIETAAARHTLEACGGNKSEAAKTLGISRRHLYVLLRRGEEE